MDTGTPAEVRAGLRSRRSAEFDAAVDAATRLGEGGDALLAEALPVVPAWDRVVVAAALGSVRGPYGAAALRQALQATGPGTRDLLRAAALALAKRREPSTTQDLLGTLTSSRDGTVREYAVVGLAYAGDGRGWDDVYAWLARQLRRSRRQASDEPPSIFALCYLLSNLDACPGRANRVATLLHETRDRLTAVERTWLSTCWPQLQVAQQEPPAPPAAAGLRAWVSSRSLFR